MNIVECVRVSKIQPSVKLNDNVTVHLFTNIVTYNIDTKIQPAVLQQYISKIVHMEVAFTSQASTCGMLYVNVYFDFSVYSVPSVPFNAVSIYRLCVI